MKKSTRSNLLFASAYAAVLVVVVLVALRFFGNTEKVDVRPVIPVDTTRKKVDEIIHIIEKKYVDDVNAHSLQHLPIDSLLHKLDPHSAYLPARKAYGLSESLEGNFDGIGVEYYILNDTLLVTSVIKDGPAYLSGLKQGDKIIKIDTTTVSGRNLPRSEMVGRIRGKRGTPVQLTLLHQGQNMPAVLTIKRGRVAVSSIDAAYMLTRDIAYVRISKFGANTDNDFIVALRNLKTQGMKKLVLDLRDNGGGYLSAATGLANQFLPENKLITYTRGKHDPRTDYFSTGGGEFEEGKLAVIINENSASASEIFAGAIQDLDRGIIIGRRSFGKGLVQEQFAFNDGSALNLTVARYYTPLGRSIQKSYKKGYNAYQHELQDRLDGGELTREPLKTDTQSRMKPFITAAGKKLFEGGGIQPDVYVKLDTVGYNKLYVSLLQKKILVDFVFDVLVDRYAGAYIAKNIDTFNISDGDYLELLKYIESQNIQIDPKQLIATKPLIYSDLKVMLCKYYLGDIGYYRANNLSDKMVKQAVASLQ